MADFAGANSEASLNGLFKTVYEDRLEKLVPDGKKILQRIKFVKKEKQTGGVYAQPVVLGMEFGITHASDSEGAFALNAPVAGQIKEAAVRGYQMVIRSVMSYPQAQRSLGGGEKAFEEATKYLIGSMLDSLQKRLEIQCLYGSTELSTVASVSGLVITLTEAEFAEGIFAGCVNMPIDIVTAAGSPRVSTTITGVNLANRTITVASAAGVVATDRVLFSGAYGKEMKGIHAILTNTSDAFGINASTYDLWKGSSFAPATTSTLSMAIIQSAVAAGVPKGLDSDVIVLCNPGHWDDLLSEQSDLRNYDNSYNSKQAENGARTIKIHTQAGVAEIVPSIYVKRGYAYILPLEDWKRVGSTDITFKRPGVEGNFFKDLEAHAGFDIRAYSDQGIFCVKPGRSVIISNLKVA